MLSHGLSRTEAARYCCCAALCYGEYRVYDTLTCDERPVYRQSVSKGAGLLYGPFLAEGELMLLALAVFYGEYMVVYGIAPVGCSIGDSARKSGGYEASVLYDTCFGAGRIDHAGCCFIAGRCFYGHVPSALCIKVLYARALRDICSVKCRNVSQRSFYAVEYIRDYAGAEHRGNRRTCALYGLTGLHSCGDLVYLYRRLV